MKRAQLIGIAVAGVAGLLAFFMVKKMVSKPPEKPVKEIVKINTVPVLVAATDIGLGQIANENQFRWQEWPADVVNTTPTLITSTKSPKARSELSGSIARSPILANEPITTQKLIKAGQGGVLAAILPPGMRAVSTKIREETAVGKLILPNDHVDVILTRTMRGKSGGEEHTSDTLFRNVRVLAIGQQIETKEGKKSAEGAANTATLELTPRQSELLALANSMGEISLALRSISELNAQAEGTEAADGLGKKAETNNAIRVLRYGVKSRAYGVN
jgi:pilus assembly protein CpaB